jgi:hypothetical protein
MHQRRSCQATALLDRSRLKKETEKEKKNLNRPVSSEFSLVLIFSCLISRQGDRDGSTRDESKLTMIVGWVRTAAMAITTIDQKFEVCGHVAGWLGRSSSIKAGAQFREPHSENPLLPLFFFNTFFFPPT